MSTFEFKTPVSDEDIRKVHIGDVIYLTGDIVTGRDDVHHRVVIGGKEPPVDLTGKAIFHAGPIMKKISSDGEPDKFKVVSVGPTTSMRMEKAQAEFLAKTGVKIIIGKGGMAPRQHRDALITAQSTRSSPAAALLLQLKKSSTVKVSSGWILACLKPCGSLSVRDSDP